ARVLGRLGDDFVGADGIHAVVDAVCAAAGITFHVIERAEMRKRPDLPRTLRGKFVENARFDAIRGAERAEVLPALAAFGLTDHNPAARDGIFTKFHDAPAYGARVS